MNDRTCWASGTGGTVVRTNDGGKSWKGMIVPGAEKLDLRDIEAVNETTVYALSSGPGPGSKIFKTTDAGANWTVQYTNPDAKGFLDAIAFFDSKRGIAFGDPIEGRFVILLTNDGGQTWKRIDPANMPPALEGEGAFAASGTCMVTLGKDHAWFATGGAKVSRVFRSTDKGKSWSVSETPISANTPSAGIFSLAFRDVNHGIAVGGDYQRLDDSKNVVATTSDGGKSWSLPSGVSPRGYRSAVVAVGPSADVYVAVGPSGTERSADGGQSWKPLGSQGFHAVSMAPGSKVGWGVGDSGTIFRYDDPTK